jgi:hypothetical protein
MVRNESDIIEAFVRHNLAVLDGLIVVDHGSSDATLPILKALCAERLPLVVKRSDSPGYLQAEITTTAAREAFGAARADAVFPLDADEFVRIGSRRDLEAALAAVPPGHCARASWPTFVADLARGTTDIRTLLLGVRRWKAKHPRYREKLIDGKVVLTAAFAQDRSANVAMGNHYALHGDDWHRSPRMDSVDLDPGLVEICHVPVRTPHQFAVKVAVKRLARVAAGRDYAEGSTIRVLYEAIRKGDPLTVEDILSHHVAVDAASLRAAFARPATSDDRFLAEFALRYTPTEPPDPLPTILAAVDGLVRRAASIRLADAKA